MTFNSLARMWPSFLNPILTLIFMNTRGRQPARNSSSRVLISLHRLAGLRASTAATSALLSSQDLPPKPPPTRALDDADVGLRHAQRSSDAVARIEQRLGVHVDRVLAVGGVFRDAADGLDGAVPLRHAGKRVFDDNVASRRRPGRRCRARGPSAWRCCSLCHRAPKARRPASLLRHRRRRQRLPVDFDQVDRFFGDIRSTAATAATSSPT